MNIEYMMWLGTGLIGAYILNRNPSKLMFGRNFEGAMLRSALSIIGLVSVMSAPFLLVIALLSRKKRPGFHFLRVEHNLFQFVPDL